MANVSPDAAAEVVVLLSDLVERMDKAAQELNHLAGTAGTPEEQDRLFGKEAGVRLAVSYVMDEYRARKANL
jgi:hypothetical protein